MDDPGLFRVFSGQAYWRLDNNGDKLWSGIAGGDGLYLWPATPQDLPVPGQWTKP